ncbi:acetolactate synthase large subunit [Breznakibacter xylanolyticus]|uniref:Acetolactate synthase n=1 Tax=Breznakibacter xylanolyticus TaxID=990 RepID=A0A2W7NLA8_9BACT|nr:biosynthetic-type acetolactate synthase large subunit [Breznakibacter xylanolyticus]PZX20293.1 acetolactate synthase large subunit [Breznakibacter xylanolyticus]
MKTHSPTSQPITGAQLLMELLKQQGIDTIFGIPGGSILPIYDAMHTSGIRHVLARHEQGAGFMAQGMARSTGKPAVCMATSGPGAVNLLTAISDAYSDSVPLIVITGQVPLTLMGTAAFQEVDVVGMSRTITKRSILVTDVNDLPQIIHDAFRLATEGRPGPVWIDIPKDVQLAPFTGHWRAPQPAMDGLTDFSSIARVQEMLTRSRRPVIIAGNGIIIANVADVLQQIAVHYRIPVLTTLHGKGAMPDGHPLNLGMAGMHGLASANDALNTADLVIALGIRFDDRLTGNVQAFCPDAKIVHVDIHPVQLNRIKPAHLAICADLGLWLTAWASLLPPAVAKPMMARVSTIEPDDVAGGWLRAFAELMPADAIVTTDVGQHQMWVAQYYPLSSPRSLLTSGGQGTMGFGLPAAIGAAIAHPHRKVVCFTGDGSLMMNIQELATLAELNLDITIVLMNNEGLGMVRQQQQLFWGERLAASEYVQPTRFSAIAQAFGIHTMEASMGDGVAALTRYDWMLPQPTFLHLQVDADQLVSPIMQPGHSINAMMDCKRVYEV